MNEAVALIHRYVRAALRRRWFAIGTAWVVALASWAVILTMPDRYESSARVFVDTRTPLRPVLEGIAIDDDYESQLALVREALLSRPQLEAVARQANLDASVATPGGMEALVSALQQQIKVEAVRPLNAMAQAREMVYTISYRHPDREKGVEVVRTLLNNFVEGTLSSNRSGAGEAQNFLNQQIGDLEKRLQEAEERRAEFQKRNIGMIPGEQGDYFQRLNQAIASAERAETDLAVAISRRAELRRQLASARAYLPGAARASEAEIPGATLDVTTRRQEAEQRLEELLVRFTERHPEVLALRQTIEGLKKQEADELAELQRGGMGTGAIRSLSANPVYQQIQSQLNQVQVEIAAYRGAATQHREEVAKLRGVVDQAPEVEQEFARLNRDYDVTKVQYDQLVARREQARVSDDAARTGIVRFDVIEPPRASLEPVAPRRELLIAAMLVVAIGAGIALAILPQLIAPTFDDLASLEHKFGLPVLGAISLVRSAAQQVSERRQTRGAVLLVLLLVAVAAALMYAGPDAVRLLQRFIA